MRSRLCSCESVGFGCGDELASSSALVAGLPSPARIWSARIGVSRPPPRFLDLGS